MDERSKASERAQRVRGAGGTEAPTGDRDRKRILARRAKLLALALATVNLEACKPTPGEAPPPEPCLSVRPEVCLSQPEPESDAGPPPEVCLSPPPQPCLSEPAPEEGPFAKPPPDRG